MPEQAGIIAYCPDCGQVELYRYHCPKCGGASWWPVDKRVPRSRPVRVAKPEQDDTQRRVMQFGEFWRRKA